MYDDCCFTYFRRTALCCRPHTGLVYVRQSQFLPAVRGDLPRFPVCLGPPRISHERKRKRTKQIVIFLNLIAAFDLVLIGIQILVLHAYWLNGIGIWTQLFYLPVLNLGFCLTNWSHGVFPAYAAGFILMVGVTFAGCKLREKGTR